MKRPAFTDSHKFAVPYRPSNQTDIRKTFARLRRQAESNTAARPVPGATEQRSAT